MTRIERPIKPSSTHSRDIPIHKTAIVESIVIELNKAGADRGFEPSYTITYYIKFIARKIGVETIKAGENELVINSSFPQDFNHRKKKDVVCIE